MVVLEALRGQGLGRSLMRAAMYRAVHAHGSARLYTSVEADNDVAVRLYRGCGFEDFSTDSKFESGLKLGGWGGAWLRAMACGPCMHAIVRAGTGCSVPVMQCSTMHAILMHACTDMLHSAQAIIHAAGASC